MLTLIELFLFVGFTVFIFLKSLAYALYEMNEENNKIGGIMVICFSLLSVIIVNLSVFLAK